MKRAASSQVSKKSLDLATENYVSAHKIEVAFRRVDNDPVVWGGKLDYYAFSFYHNVI